MYQRTITKATLTAFHRHLQEAERRPATIAKYLREVQDFARHLEPGQPVEKETVLAWKAALARRYAAGTVNGKLAALNTFFAFLGWGECRVKPLRRQRELFRDPGRELHKGDYLRLLAALLPHGDLGFHRGADLGAAVCDGPNPPHRAGLGGGEGERPAGPSHPQAVPGAGQVLPAAGNHRWAGVRHPDGAAHGPVQHLEGVTPSL